MPPTAQAVRALAAALLLVLAGGGRAAAAEAGEPAPGSTEAAAKLTADRRGFALASADGAFALRLRGYLQVDGRGFLEGGGADTFVLRRARPILEGTLWRFLDFRFMPDFGGGSTSIQDAWLEARLAPGARLRAGKFRPPVGLERLQSSTDLALAERALASNLVPNRDVGVQLGGEVGGGRFEYAVGLFNGVADGASGDADASGDLEAAARLFVRPWGGGGAERRPDLGLGVAGSLGDKAGTPAATELPRFRTAGQQTFFAYRADGDAAGTAVASGRHLRLAPQGWLYAGPFGLMAEWTASKQRVALGEAARSLRHEAWQVTLSWAPTGERLSFQGTAPERPFEPGGPGRGAVVLSVRASALEIDRDAFPRFADPARSARRASALGAGVSWDLVRRNRLMLDVERTTFAGGGPGGSDREDETALFLRLQVAF